jgi:cell fate regulator YaaT (PSP1 superfamily)
MERTYLIRYGLMGEVGRFSAGPGGSFDRGQAVVIRSHRGTELGEVLIEAPDRGAAGLRPSGSAYVLRAATPEDLELGRRAERERAERFAVCQQLFRDGVWPIDLIDAEPLLDRGRTVLYYLGPHKLDVDGLRAALRSSFNLDVTFQPVGADAPEAEPSAADDHSLGGCGAGGGCGSGSGSGCGSAGHGCADCGVKKLLARSQ